MMINHDIATVRECSVHDSQEEFFELSMGGLNWDGNRQPKLSYKSDGPPFLFSLQEFQKNFPPLTCLDWNLETMPSYRPSTF